MGFFADKVIPAFIFIFMAFIVIRAFKTPLGDLMDWIRRLISSGKERAANRADQGGGLDVAYE